MISRALILDNDKVLLIHRFKDGREYFVLPGGHIEDGETEEETLIREIKEETNLDAQIDKHLWTLKNPFDNSETPVAKSDIESEETSPISLMPGGLINALNEDELRNLIAYLKAEK